MNHAESQSGIIMIMGIPASGKTTLSKRLVGELVEFRGKANRVTYDEFPGEWPVGTLKDKHGAILSYCQTLIQDGNLVIIDDTFHLKSMRKPYWQLAKRRGMGICFIQLDCSLECSIRNDSFRTKVVGEKVIRKINEQFELLSPAQRQFQIRDCKIDTILRALDQSRAYFEQIANVHQSSFKDPAPNPVHQLNILLNRRVSELIESLPRDVEFNTRKAQILHRKQVLFHSLRSLQAPLSSIDSEFINQRMH